MKIEALKFYADGEMQEAFALGGSKDPSKIDPDRKFPASLQNWLIDTGTEVILIDTGLPRETPPFEFKPNMKLYMGNRVNTFPEALEKAGYKPEDVDRIIVTHKHPDHTGELRMFPNARVYLSRTEAVAMGLEGVNIVKVDFTDGPFANFDRSQKIIDGLTMLPAPGHTTGNSIVVLEYDGLSYMFHGDITYTDQALIEGELSVVMEDKDKAMDSLNRVREYIKAHDTVYLSTHTPEGYQHLENLEIMSL